MSDPITSTDPTKKLYSPAPPPPPPPKAKEPAVNLEYLPSGAGAASWKPPPPLANINPTLLSNELLERNYFGLRAKIAANPGAATKEEHALLAKMEKTIEERQGSAKESPNTPVAMLADSGATIGKGAEKAHMTTGEVEKYVAEYTAYVASRESEPKYAALHADAVVNGPKMIAAARAADEKKQIDALRLAAGEMMNEGKIKAMQVPKPIGLQPSLMVSAVSIPVAHGVDVGLGAVPVVGLLFTALELATGKTMGGLGTDIPDTDRILGAAMLLIPHAGKLLAAGGKSAAAIAEIAKRTGKSTDEVITLLSRARTLEKDAKALAEASSRMKAGKPLLPEHAAALARAETQLQFKMRKYQPTVTADTKLKPGEGATDKYGNVTFSPYGTKEQIALAKAHESVHSLLSPKTMNGLLEIRASVGMNGYARSSALRYTEEAAAEVYAQCKVKGLSWESVRTGMRFPVKEGYVTLLPSLDKMDGVPVQLQYGVATEAVLGIVIVAGVAYKAVLNVDKAMDAKAAKKEKP